MRTSITHIKVIKARVFWPMLTISRCSNTKFCVIKKRCIMWFIPKRINIKRNTFVIVLSWYIVFKPQWPTISKINKLDPADTLPEFLTHSSKILVVGSTVHAALKYISTFSIKKRKRNGGNWSSFKWIFGEITKVERESRKAMVYYRLCHI